MDQLVSTPASLTSSINLSQTGTVTLWKAASLAGLSLWQFTEEVKKRKIAVPYTLDDAKEDVRSVFG